MAAVTGAASGIGRAIALRLAASGVALTLADTDGPGLNAVAAEIRSAGGKVEHRTVDVRRAAEVNAWADESVASFGTVTMVWNVAGIINAGSVVDSTVEDLALLMDVDFWGVVHVTKAFLPHLIGAGGGHVVNVSSAFGLISAPGYSGYNAAKAAVRGWSDALRQEMHSTGTGVAVTAVYPGGIRTPIMRNATSAAGPDDARRRREFFDRHVARTDPDRAADTIIRAVAARRSRVLVGPDAYVADALARLTATGYEHLIRKPPRPRW
nr:SDR family NAD(P)-dependent oxidoreductase [Kineosporia sp. NBRC 101731]